MRFVFNPAADMGGMGFIETHKADCMLSVPISTDIVEAIGGVKLERVCNLSAPKEVRGRNSDNSLIGEKLWVGLPRSPSRPAWKRPTAGVTTG